MIENYWHNSGHHGICARITLRIFQFVLAVITAALYGIDLASWAHTSEKADPNWIYAEVVAALSALTGVAHCFFTITSVTWCVWDGVLFLLWLVLAAVFGQIIFLVRGETNQEDFSMRNMKAAFWIDLFSMLLWLATAVEGCLWCFVTRKITRQTDKQGNRAGKLTTRKEADHRRIIGNASGLYHAAFTKAESSISEEEEEEELFFLAPPKYSPRSSTFPISLNIVIQVVGSRGDVQPFLALGNALQKDGHRVRIATHSTFASFVRSANLEFFPIGGNPAELMAYMVSNPSLITRLATIREGAIQRKRQMYQQMLAGIWEACVFPDLETGFLFVADAIITNPPSFAHVHCAEALAVPVHLVFTMPWSSTGAFAQPLAGLGSLEMEKENAMVNYASYAAADFLTWQGLGGIVNDWRVNMLDLEPVPATEGPRLIEILKVPFTYCWSPSLVPKPAGWGSHTNVCGFFFRDPPSYTPTPELHDFLQSGVPPIYIGFGSIVVDNPDGLVSIVLQAVKNAGVRAIISRGWSNLTGEQSHNIFYIDDCPHEWLFQHVAAVVHHGGAGTTACGLRYGRPTAIVTFFGDQSFWGLVVAQAGAGPVPIPYEYLTSQKLCQSIKFCLSPEVADVAAAIGRNMALEDGLTAAVDFFYSWLPPWVHGRGKRKVKMCRGVATILRTHGKIDEKNLRLHRSGNIVIENRRWDPITAISSASISTVVGVADATAGIVSGPYGEYRKDALSRKTKQNYGTNVDMTGKVVGHNTADVLPISNDMGHHLPESELPQYTCTAPHVSAAGTMVAASANNMVKVLLLSAKGVLVDIPVAATEGMRAVPELWGQQIKRYEPVKDWRSGVTIAYKSFYEGMYGAATDIFVRTYEMKREEGASGVAKGLGQGFVGFATKTSAAVLGLAAYPAQGLSRSIRAAIKCETKRIIKEAKWKEGEWLVKTREFWNQDHEAILEDFDGLRGRKGQRSKSGK
ncbi:UDP-glucose,sterol transferase [Trichoderma evansii]